MTAAVACAHCGLAVPVERISVGPEPQFCCAGCRAVHDTIRAWGLERFYELRTAGAPRVPARTTGRGYAHLDHPAFRERQVTRTAGGLAAVDLYLEGLHCAGCVWIVERLPRLEPGIVEARLDLGRQVVRLVWDDARLELSRVARLLDSLGYPSHPYRGASLDAERRREQRRFLVRIAVAGAIAGNVMVLSFALFGGMFGGMAPEFAALFRATSLGLTVLALVGPGRVFLVGAISSLRTRVAHMDLPVAIGLVAGTVWGAANTLRGAGHTYFESLTMVIFLLLVGRYLLFRRQRAAQDAVELLFGLTPGTARRIEGGAVREVPVEALAPGERVEVRAGDAVPADGTLEDGPSSFDVSLLTGESVPHTLDAGARVWAGTQNVGRRVVVRIETTGAETRVGRLMALVERFARERPPIVRMADRIAHRFVLVVLALAAGTAALWLRIDAGRAVENAVALLIVTCPCALGMATPLAIVAAVGHAARRGILVKGGEALEALASIRTVLLDKTGTLTRGTMRVVRFSGDGGALAWVAAAERHVAHPVARAFVDAAGADAERVPALDVSQSPGRGIEARGAGRSLVAGAPAFVGERVGGLDAAVLAEVDRCTADGLTPVVVALDGAVAGVAGLGDPPHADSAAAVAELAGMGLRLGVVSGDDPRVVAAVAAAVGIAPGATFGGATPERKAEIVREEIARGARVAMVGDGANDSAALAAGTVGIAVHGGAEASLSAADVYLREPGLRPLVTLFEGARRTVRVIRRNVLVSLLYNVVTGGLAIAGMIDPLIASILMPVSSLTVVTLSHRSRTFQA